MFCFGGVIFLEGSQSCFGGSSLCLRVWYALSYYVSEFLGAFS